MNRHFHVPPTAQYLDARVTTASQPELQLMLLDGALRFGRQAQALWADPSQFVESDRLATRALDIVTELVRSVAGGSTVASQRLEEEYAFAYRTLASAKVNRDETSLEQALALLAYQRETWRLAWEKVKTEEGGSPAAAGPSGAAAGSRRLPQSVFLGELAGGESRLSVQA